VKQTGGPTVSSSSGASTAIAARGDREGSSSAPAGYALDQNFPNPFNPVTLIKFSIPEAGLVHLTVHNVLGQEVAEVVNREAPAGVFEVSFDASRLASGVYYYKLTSGNFADTKRMVVVK
jgi:hypothetical protein